eukprot:scaffold1766_cov401-Prasinococcus_capsulatus_cf.AAC.16
MVYLGLKSEPDRYLQSIGVVAVDGVVKGARQKHAGVHRIPLNLGNAESMCICSTIIEPCRGTMLRSALKLHKWPPLVLGRPIASRGAYGPIHMATQKIPMLHSIDT